MNIDNYIKKFGYDFGSLYCYNNYVISDMKPDTVISTDIAKIILKDVHDFYGSNGVVYISNRNISFKIDPGNYKLVNAKKLIGIAIVGYGEEVRNQAFMEQSLYPGSFGFFDNLESAVSWAQSFAKSKATGS